MNIYWRAVLFKHKMLPSNQYTCKTAIYLPNLTSAPKNTLAAQTFDTHTHYDGNIFYPLYIKWTLVNFPLARSPSLYEEAWLYLLVWYSKWYGNAYITLMRYARVPFKQHFAGAYMYVTQNATISKAMHIRRAHPDTPSWTYIQYDGYILLIYGKERSWRIRLKEGKRNFCSTQVFFTFFEGCNLSFKMTYYWLYFIDSIR